MTDLTLGKKTGRKKRKGERFSDDTICTDHLHSGLKERKGREERRKEEGIAFKIWDGEKCLMPKRRKGYRSFVPPRKQ